MALRFDESAYLQAHQIGEENRRKSKFNMNEALGDVGKITTGIMSPKIEMKKAMRERQEKAPELLIKLRENNVPAPDANAAVANYIRNGKLEISSEKFGKPKDKKALYYQEGPGKPFTMQEIPEGIEPVVRGIGDGGTAPLLWVDPNDPNAKPKKLGDFPKSTKVISPPKETPEKEDPELKDQRATFKTLIAQKAKYEMAGEEVPEEVTNQLIELAPVAGYTAEQVVTKPARFFGLLKEKKQTVFKPTSGEAKTLTPEIAQGYLKKANGDKAKARELAKQDGYSF